MQGTPGKFVLTSHPGKALVQNEQKEGNFPNPWDPQKLQDDFGPSEPVAWFTVGDAGDAVEVDLSMEGGPIKLAKTDRAFDCVRGSYHRGNEVVVWKHHGGDNQQFLINADYTISPKSAPTMVWAWE